MGGDKCERGGKEGVRPLPKGHLGCPISAGERNHRSSQQMEIFFILYRCPALWAGSFTLPFFFEVTPDSIESSFSPNMLPNGNVPVTFR